MCRSHYLMLIRNRRNSIVMAKLSLTVAVAKVILVHSCWLFVFCTAVAQISGEESFIIKVFEK